MLRLAGTVVLVFAVHAGCGDSKSEGDKAAAKPSADDPQHTPESARRRKRRGPPRPIRRGPKRRTAKPKKPKQYWTLLRKGRAAERAGKHVDAITSFDAALKLVPDDPRLLSELSWAAFGAKQYERATKAAQTAIARSTRSTIKAEALYNLGRTLEAQGKPKQALRAYHRSQVLRPHKVVAARIKTISGSAPPVIVTPLPAAPAGTRPKFDLDEWWGVQLTKPSPPFAAAFIQENDEAMCDLFIRVGRSWRVVYKVADCPGNNKYWNTSATLSTVKVGGKTLLRLDVTEGERDYRTNKRGAKTWQVQRTKAVVLCGVGTSGELSCTPRIVTERSVSIERKGAKPTITEQRRLELAPGKLIVTDDGKKTEHPLTFR